MTEEVSSNVLNLLSKDLRYEKFIKKFERRIQNLGKNVILYALVNNLIDQDGLWLIFEPNNWAITNHVSQYTNNKLFIFKSTNEDNIESNKNVDIVQGKFSETIVQFKNNIGKIYKSGISFMIITSRIPNQIFLILITLYKNLKNKCVIIFESFINFSNYEKYALKAFYDFFNAYKIQYEWIGSERGILTTPHDGFTNEKIQTVGLRILSNPYFNEMDVSFEKEDNYDNFDWEMYIKYYEDLKFNTTKESAWDHWTKHGMDEKRIFFRKYSDKQDEYEFDWENYIAIYQDLSHIKTKEDAWNHWLNYGKKEGRKYIQVNASQIKRTSSIKNINSEFDWFFYVNNYEDLSEITNEKDAWNHWINHGKNENRIGIFDWCSYIGNLNVDCINTKEDALDHWMKNGKKRFELPVDFNWIKYLIKNPDLYSFVRTESESKNHWLNFGQFENRTYL
jgi:hypothetical protein